MTARIKRIPGLDAMAVIIEVLSGKLENFRILYSGEPVCRFHGQVLVISGPHNPRFLAPVGKHDLHLELAALDVKCLGLELVIMQAATLASLQYELFSAVKLVVMNPVLAAPTLGHVLYLVRHG